MSVMGLTLVFLMILLSNKAESFTQAKCIQGKNCLLPNCSCTSTSSPLPVKDTPQIIYFGFDDALTNIMSNHYRKLFPSHRRNPNNCPISMTLYIQDAYTNYGLVNEFYKKGMEIAVHSVTHTNIDTEKKLTYEAGQQKRNLADNGQVPNDEIVGWRSPNLKTAGDKQPSTLKKLGYTYDISLTHTVRKLGEDKPWPYTLDFGYPYRCMVQPCPSKTNSHPGFWEVPIISLIDYKEEYPCSYVDGCNNSPVNEQDSYKYLIKNFEDYYKTRTPLGFNMHAAWFQRPFNLAAMDRFITEMSKKDDVYIVTVQKMLEWMKNPTKLSDLHNFKAWDCSSEMKTRSSNVVIPVPTVKTVHVPNPQPRSRSFQAKCIQGDNCLLPNCSCTSTSSPLPVKDTPQIIYFGFDDALTNIMSNHYRKLFPSDRKNPNNCPISMTLYIQDAYTNYGLVNEFYKKGMEIAVHSVTHTNIDTEKKLTYEAGQQKRNLADNGQVPNDEIVGWRSPNLKTAGDKQPSTLKKLGYTYDISLTHTVRKLGEDKPWPYTLDFGYPYSCMVRPCPSKTNSHPGFWEVPIISLIDYKEEYPCSYVDGCNNSPVNEHDSYKYLIKNFEDYYKTRTPLGFNMHAAWFQRPYNLAAMDRFITEMSKKDDVYIVTVQKMLEWMKHPTKLSDLHNFKGWDCSSEMKTRSSNNVVSESDSTTTHIPNTQPITATEDDTMFPSTTTTKTVEYVKSTPAPTSKAGNAKFGPPSPRSCTQGITCTLPECQCRSLLPPGGLSVNRVPQMIYFTFDGPLNQISYSYYLKIFNKYRKNPNKCPISATLFVSKGGNVLPFLMSLADRGLEIALQGDEPYSTRNSINRHVDFSKELHSMVTRFPVKAVGWRSPSLKPLGENQYKVLHDSQMLYDSTLTTRQASGNLSWPYTLDFGWKDACPVGGCPKMGYPGLWEIPAKPMLGVKKLYPCIYADGCLFNPWTEKDTFDFFMDNFQRYYKGNRSPMSISFQQTWFFHQLYRPNVKGLIKFIDKILSYDDVYIVSIKQLIQWLQQPTPLSELGSFSPWRC